MPAGSYTQEASARTYAAFLARAETILKAGHSVVLDAVFAKPEERAAAEALAARVVARGAVGIDPRGEIDLGLAHVPSADVQNRFSLELGLDATVFERRRLSPD